MITQKRLKEVLHYCPETGVFTRLIVTGNNGPIGQVVGRPTTSKGSRISYLRIGIDKYNYGAHRLAFLYMTGKIAKVCVDHIDGDGLNNKWSNIIESSKSENAKNCYLNSANTSGFAGVTWSKQIKRWTARIYIGGKSTHIGCFKDKQDAINCRKDAEIKHGYSSRHGEPFKPK